MLVSLLLIGGVAWLSWRYLTRNFAHWKKKGVKFVPNPKPLIGSMSDMFFGSDHVIEFYNKMYSQYEGEPYVGFYQSATPTLLLRDPDLIKQIYIKDFSHFTDHGLINMDEDIDPLQAKNLFHMSGDRWRQMRAKLTPTFTSGRIKSMVPLVEECAVELEKYFDQLAKTEEPFEAKEIITRFTTDVIGSCAFGIKCNSIREPDNQFRTMSRKLFDMSLIQKIRLAIIMLMPALANALRLSITSKEVTNFFRKMVKDGIEFRKRTGTTRKDFMQLLIELQEKGSIAALKDDDDHDNDHFQTGNWNIKQMKLTDDDITAQAFVFFLAGFETTSTLLSFALLELAVNQDVQRRLQQDIDQVLISHEDKMSYDALLQMHYLDWTIQETLRKYPPTLTIARICTKNYVIPDTNVTIEQGTPIVIPLGGLQNDPKYFPDPDKFDPDRFSNDETSQKNKFIYTPFGEGPRQCIGNRFALMQSKLTLCTILRKFNVDVTPRTSYPVVLDKNQPGVFNKGGIVIKVTARS